MKFTKMQGCGNDYIYVNLFEEQVIDPSKMSAALSDRHFGVGADGLILIAPSECADFRMEMYNADGSRGEMCGNGIRCLAKYVYDHGLTDQVNLSVETDAGIRRMSLTVESGKVSAVCVDMGSPVLEAERIPVTAGTQRVIDEPISVAGRDFRMTCVSVGNPHAVVFVDNVRDFDIEKYGPVFENHERFPNRVNTEFVQVDSRTEISVRVWERGSAETFACGTGACASVCACIVNHYTEHEVLVHLKGGDLTVRYDEANDCIFMTGPAEEVFSGELAG